jgi:hypothetical protein
MTVYVDDARIRATVRRLTAVWSHLMADSHDELVDFARRLGLQAGWIQFPGEVKEHFDVTESYRQRAIRLGARPITARQAGLLLIQRRRALAGEPAGPVQPAQPATQPVQDALPLPAAPASDRPAPKWNPKTRRHSWLKVREHVYRCRFCDLNKTNVLDGGDWVVRWEWPDWASAAVVGGATPPCLGPAE